jgi:hypothetical protein
MSATAESRFKSGFRYSGGGAPREQDSPAIGSGGQLATSVLIEQRDRALRLLEQTREDAHQRIEALVAVHDGLIASMVAYHQRELDVLQAQLDAAHGGHERRPTIIPESPALGSEFTGGVTAGVSAAGSISEAQERENSELRSELAAANAEIEATRADAIRLQGERDDALCAADDVRLQILSEIGAARDEAIQVQAQLDDALRMVDDGRDQAREEQLRFVEELDALHQKLAAHRQKLA